MTPSAFAATPGGNFAQAGVGGAGTQQLLVLLSVGHSPKPPEAAAELVACPPSMPSPRLTPQPCSGRLQAATPPSDVYEEGLHSAFKEYASFGTRGEGAGRLGQAKGGLWHLCRWPAGGPGAEGDCCLSKPGSSFWLPEWQWCWTAV